MPWFFYNNFTHFTSSQQGSLTQQFNKQMFFYDQDHFQIRTVAEDCKSLTCELSTAVHNSPATAKFKLLDEEEATSNCSFDQGGQEGHAQNVWDASVTYLQSILRSETDHFSSMNDESLFEIGQDIEVLSEKKFDQLVLGNWNLSIQQRHEFVRVLKNEPELLALFNELSALFNLTVFNQIAYLLYKIWEKRVELLTETVNVRQDQCSIVPRFFCFANLENEDSILTNIPFKEKKTEEQIQKEAQICSKALAAEMFYDAKLKLLSFRECKKDCQNEETIRSSFEKFFGILTKSVFLSLEGFFCVPEDESEMSFDFSVDWAEENQVSSECSLEDFVAHQNLYTRKFSDFEDSSSEESGIEGSGKKKRKLN